MDTKEGRAAARADLLDRVPTDYQTFLIPERLGHLLHYGTCLIAMNEHQEMEFQLQERVPACYTFHNSWYTLPYLLMPPIRSSMYIYSKGPFSFSGMPSLGQNKSVSSAVTMLSQA